MARRANVWKTKREAGSGSYRRRGNGSWQLTVRDADGKRHTKTVKASNETEVKRMLRDFTAAVRRDEVPKAKGRPTVAQVADMWFEHKLGGRLAGLFGGLAALGLVGAVVLVALNL